MITSLMAPESPSALKQNLYTVEGVESEIDQALGQLPKELQDIPLPVLLDVFMPIFTENGDQPLPNQALKTRERSGYMEVLEKALTVDINDPCEETEDIPTGEEDVLRFVQEEMLDIDEVVNLLDEDEMHVFDCAPLVDPLELVFCKQCKKPVKASQFSLHVENCRLRALAYE